MISLTCDKDDDSNKCKIAGTIVWLGLLLFAVNNSSNSQGTASASLVTYVG